MLAQEPGVILASNGGGISVRVNGTPVLDVSPDADKRLSGNVGNQDNAPSSPKPTITWRTRAHHASEENPAVHPQPVNGNSVLPLEMNGTSSVPQLVHVIRVNPPQDKLMSSTRMNPPQDKLMSSTRMQTTATLNQSNIRISSAPYSANTVEFGKDKISVLVVPGMKGEDERSSSGASSAPGSDCERSDSDREAEDGNDSGFSSAQRHFSRLSVNAVIANNQVSDFTHYHTDHVVNASDVTPVDCQTNGTNVRLTIASYSDKDPVSRNGEPSDELMDMPFHLRELDSAPLDKTVEDDDDDVQTKIASAHAILAGVSSGTLRNRVRSSIVSLLGQSTSNRNYEVEEAGRIVLYTTSSGIVRKTFDACSLVRKILDTLMVRYEERDVFMNLTYQQEVKERLNLSRVVVPQLFLEGHYLGPAEMVQEFNEIGELRKMLRNYKRRTIGVLCSMCSGHRYLLCSKCAGCKRTPTPFGRYLRCVSCDEGGLVRCPNCLNGEADN